ncbi:hypothetical protein ACM1RC_33065 [Paenibacillus azoreducens]|uniref:hypothetical protein n=1 Tax=Paenibacillus azoreducens TaxID=116718 RepID=UPI0039F4687C
MAALAALSCHLIDTLRFCGNDEKGSIYELRKKQLRKKTNKRKEQGIGESDPYSKEEPFYNFEPGGKIYGEAVAFF